MIATLQHYWVIGSHKRPTLRYGQVGPKVNYVLTKKDRDTVNLWSQNFDMGP